MNHTILPLLSHPTSHLISFVIHFPLFRVTNIQSSQTFFPTLTTLIAFFFPSLLISDFIQFSSHILVFKSLSIAHCFYFYCHLLHQPFARISFISFINQMIIINMPLKQTHSSFSISLCPHLIASLSYFFL